jgi:hypothetical protein
MARPATYRAPIDVDRAFFSKFLEFTRGKCRPIHEHSQLAQKYMV